METEQTAGCGCQTNTRPIEQNENCGIQRDDHYLCDVSCEFLNDPHMKRILDKIMEFPEGYRIKNGIYKDISPDEAYKLISKHENNTDFTVLDVRTENEFNASRIPDSMLIDFFSSNFKDKLVNFDKSKTYVVFCKVGGRSKLAMNLMEKMGFKEVYNVVGGEDRWIMEEIPYGFPQNPSEWADLPVKS